MTPRCEARKVLRGAIGTLECHREPDHGGMHRDNTENLYWMDGAPPLEVVEIPQAREIDPALSRTLGRLRGGIEL
ncbi:hypothetical protein SEA_FIREMAN_7 [Microbacterium phage Fireman]|uniref:Uncharacterized protein n=1 Tax=Microbacterium phage Fireman TaxID=2530118 RepID=A0A481VX28_9CAUD|nr:hypothetical protein HOV22_gp08 [Microbacterium phage Fireman]QBI98091.1 hypothetical protein SEA_FIREMAN_7 [Microbacterium phage Fireman]